MALTAGTRLGPYEIVALAGAGGMGEVYKARDTRLDRTVAIKVLPPHASSNTELKQRFEREAQTVGGLNHPHICVLHDVGREGDTDFLVMEYVEGETLARRLERGALSVDEALSVAIQMADALDQAHQRGVVHRDLKPANVMLVQSGASRSGGLQVKLLDFGLAKLTAPADPAALGLTVPAELTGPGTVLGTMRYMAPEQVEGKDADARTDIFAFGAVLYEMLTGKKAFDGKSQPSLIAAIMNAEPAPLATLVPVTPRALERLVKRCLAKDPENRWQTAHDLLVQLKWIANRGAKQGSTTAAGVRGPRERVAIAALAVGLLLTTAMATPAYLYLRGSAPPEEFRFRVPAVGLNPADIAISPDGESIAMVARPGTSEPSSIYVRPVASVTFQKLAGTDDASQPFWSPDSRSIGFVAGGRLKKVEAAGTPPQDITAVTGFFGGTWSKDGTILIGSAAGIRQVSAEGGTPQAVTAIEKPETGHYWPYFLPDGRHFLYLAWSGDAANRAIFVGTLGSKDKTRLLPAESNVAYAAPGYLVFRREATVLAQAFDAGGLKLSGAPVQIAGGVAFNAVSGHGSFDVSQTGALIFFQGAAAAGTGRGQVTPDWQFAWHDRHGNVMELAGEAGSYGDMDLSPDGKLIAVTRQDAGAPGADIWVLDWQRGVSTRLTLDPSDDINPVWSPDGRRIAFTTFRKGNADIYVKNANGVGDETPLLESPVDESVEDWSKDGRYIAYRQDQDGFDDLYVLPIDADGKPGKPTPIVKGKFHKDEPQFSYDGKWLAYTSDESGTYEVYVVSFPALDQKLKVSDGGGGRPRWREDGKEIFFQGLSGSKLTVDFKPGPKIEVGVSHLLWSTNNNSDATRHLWAVSRDGQRFLIRTLTGTTARGVTPTATVNFLPAGQNAQGGRAGGGGRGPAPNAPAANGLTVVRHWTAAFKKAPK
jgi:Tol biopolymer transport system component/tRNA A-37 threonylcarbamoyl transferase component Bud32